MFSKKMLQIKKIGKLVSCKYNLQFLFKRSAPSLTYLVKKQVGHSITLRAPKHFNIGKNKILSLNYKTPYLFINRSYNFFSKSLFLDTSILFKLLQKRIKTTPALNVGSVRLKILTKFTLKWLEI